MSIVIKTSNAELRDLVRFIFDCWSAELETHKDRDEVPVAGSDAVDWLVQDLWPRVVRLMDEPETPDELRCLPMSCRVIAFHTLRELQAADEIGGPDAEDYVALMRWLRDECNKRAVVAAAGERAAMVDAIHELIEYAQSATLEGDPKPHCVAVAEELIGRRP